MATIVPSPPAKTSKGEPPSREETRGNVLKPELGRVVALNFKVPAEFKKDFKIAAATYGVTQSELLRQAFTEWLQRHGMTPAISRADGHLSSV
jgi:hypothetical protein